VVQSLSRSLAHAGLSAYEDDSSSSVGKRYARADELGVPFAITVDFETSKDNHVTIRERDSTKQVRVKVESVVMFIEKKVDDI
jgi:glycyl-tRNA synthetase